MAARLECRNLRTEAQRSKASFATRRDRNSPRTKRGLNTSAGMIGAMIRPVSRSSHSPSSTTRRLFTSAATLRRRCIIGPASPAGDGMLPDLFEVAPSSGSRWVAAWLRPQGPIEIASGLIGFMSRLPDRQSGTRRSVTQMGAREGSSMAQRRRRVKHTATFEERLAEEARKFREAADKEVQAAWPANSFEACPAS